jgi:adenine/guanine phosphoribosyltransferase-like PRPP-binding protein
MFIFKSYKDLISDVQKLLPKIPRDISAVIGIPRSGMVPAAMISTQIRVPLGMLAEDGTLVIAEGQSTGNKSAITSGKLLLVDDSITTGESLQTSKKLLDKECVTCVIYATPTSVNKVDIYGEVTKHERFSSGT